MPGNGGDAARGRVLGLPPRIALGFATAIACLGAAALFSWRALDARTAAASALSHTMASQLAVEEIESALLVSDVALDAWLAGGEGRHQARHLRARSKLEPALAALAILDEGEAAERALLARIAPATRVVMEEHARAFALAADGRAAEARALRARGAGAAALAEAKEACEGLEAHEAAELAARQEARATTVAVSNGIFAGALGLLVLLVLGAARLVRDEIAARERALAVQQRLVAVVSHDLRNPLCGVLTAGWALTRMRDAGEEARRAGARVVGAGRRMERLIRDLLDWSRVQAGAPVPVEPREADVFELCRTVAAELSPSDAVRVALEREGDTRAHVDPDRIEQVVANLVVNALKYGPPGRPVRLKVAGAESEVRVEVVDEGGAIPAAAQAELFQPFRRGAGGLHASQSLGLGLFIVRTLTEAHGGAVELSSSPGGGTTFAVRLPRGARPLARA